MGTGGSFLFGGSLLLMIRKDLYLPQPEERCCESRWWSSVWVKVLVKTLEQCECPAALAAGAVGEGEGERGREGEKAKFEDSRLDNNKDIR
jgi:hypothetical protein